MAAEPITIEAGTNQKEARSCDRMLKRDTLIARWRSIQLLRLQVPMRPPASAGSVVRHVLSALLMLIGKLYWRESQDLRDTSAAHEMNDQSDYGQDQQEVN